MRNAFINTLHTIAKNDDRIFVVLADLGILMFDEFKREFPGRLINVGVAESNMIGVAAGLALSRKIPFVYTIAPFATMRCLEQIRVAVCYQDLDVKIVGVGGGLAYGVQGTTHHAIEDIGVMRSLPNMTVISPADPIEAGKATEAMVKHKGPVYLRLVREKEPPVNPENYEFIVGKASVLRRGKDATVIAHGVQVNKALLAAQILSEKDNIELTVINMPTIKPLDEEAVIVAAETGAVITVEEHSIVGGLGSAVAEVIAEKAPRKVLFNRIGLRDSFCVDCGSHDYLQRKYGLSEMAIAQSIRDSLKLGDNYSGATRKQPVQNQE